MALEAIVLNPPIRPVKLSRSELEALAGWPSSGGRPRLNGRKRKMAKVSAYARFVGKQMKSGKSMKAAARLWKSKGSSKRGKKRGAKKAKRNYGTHLGAVHTAKGAGTTVHRYFSRLGTKGARSKYGKSYKYSVNRGKKSFLRNVGAKGLTSFKESFKDLLKVDTFIEAAEVTGGGLLSVALPNVILNWGPVAKVTPDALKSGWGKYLVNLAAAAVASGAAGWFGKKRMAKNFLVGGVAFTVNTVVLDLLRKQASAVGAGDTTKKIAAAVGVSGMGALPSQVEAAVDKAVEAELARQGLRDMLPAGTGDFMEPGVGDYLQPGMADYLQPGMADVPSANVI